MEHIILSFKQANDSSWMNSLQENSQYEFCIHLTEEWMIQESKAYDIISEISGRFVGSMIMLEQQEVRIAADPNVVMGWLPNLQLEGEKYYLGKLHIHRTLGLMLSFANVVRSRWTFRIMDIK